MAFYTKLVKIEFSHPEIDYDELFEEWGVSIPKGESRRCTRVNIIDLESEDIVSCTVSVCHKIDNFSKSIGRKKALALALQDYNKEFRTEVWDEYNRQIGRN